MKEWEYDALEYDALRDEHKFNEVSECEVECYEDGSVVEDGNPEDKETFFDIWYQCSCGEKYRTEDEAIECCFQNIISITRNKERL